MKTLIDETVESHFAYFYTMAVAGEGTIFFADAKANCIRKWTHGGVPRIYALSPVLDFAINGNIVPHWRLTMSMQCTGGLQDFVGNCSHEGGYADGLGLSAKFLNPKGLCYSRPLGYLAVVDDACIRKVSLQGKAIFPCMILCSESNSGCLKMRRLAMCNYFTPLH